MTKTKKLFQKRRFHGNRHKSIPHAAESPHRILTPDAAVTTCASSSKLSNSPAHMEELKASVSDRGYVLIDIDLLSCAVAESCACKACGGDLKLVENAARRAGLACTYSLNCEKCCSTHQFETSKRTTSGFYEVNVRIVYALRCIGKGAAAGGTLCAMLNLPKPPTKFSRYNAELLAHVSAVTEESMKRAAKEAVALNEGDKDIAIALDGSWQRRGHTSHNGLVSATSVDSGKVLDLEVMTKHCSVCASKGNSSGAEHEHKCQRNYEGASGGRKTAGALSIFQRSEELHGVRYVKYPGGRR
ncbi:unnamed protein product [Ixodes pacificus]